jgi:hypothetical protein
MSRGKVRLDGILPGTAMKMTEWYEPEEICLFDDPYVKFLLPSWISTGMDTRATRDHQAG